MAASSSIQPSSMKIQDGNYYCFESVHFGGKYISAVNQSNTLILSCLDMEQIEDVKKYGGMGVWKAKECADNLFAFESRRFNEIHISITSQSEFGGEKHSNSIFGSGKRSNSFHPKSNFVTKTYYSLFLKNINDVTENEESGLWKVKDFGKNFFAFESKKFSGKHIGLVKGSSFGGNYYELVLIDDDVKANRGCGLWRIRELGRNYWEVERSIGSERHSYADIL